MTKEKEMAWKLAKNNLPFSKNIGGDQFFKFSQLEGLRAAVSLAVAQGVGAVVSGQAGTGKTSGVRSVTDELAPNEYQVLYVGQDYDGGNIGRRIELGLGLAPKRYRKHTWLQVSQYLSDNLVEHGRKIVLVIDEAHLLSPTTLEELRLLMNADFDRATPLSLILIGQLPLRTMLRAPGFEALNQRLRYRFSMDGFTEEEAGNYIRHHLRLGDLPENIFLADAIKLLFMASKGILRELNNTCLLALLRAETEGLASVDGKLVKQMLEQRELS